MIEIEIIKIQVEEIDYSILSTNILNRVNKYNNKTRRETSAFVYYYLKKYKNIEVNFINNHPIIKNGYISISHSNEYVVIAYSTNRIGVDIEMERVISKRIINKMHSTTSNEFFRIWTKLEAYIKYSEIEGVDIRNINIDDINLYCFHKEVILDNNIYYLTVVCDNEVGENDIHIKTL